MSVSYVERDFVLHCGPLESDRVLRISVTIPQTHSLEELVQRCMIIHNIPCYLENDLSTQLAQFVERETEEWNDINASKSLDRVINKEVDIEDLVNKWNQVFTQEVKKYGPPEEVTNEQVFSEVYHNLIHSATLQTLLNLEHTYAIAVGDLIKKRNLDLEKLKDRQSQDMQTMVQNLGLVYTDVQVNDLAQSHFENIELTESKWASELSTLTDTQKKEYREWVMTVHEDTHTNRGATPQFFQNDNTVDDNPEEDPTSNILYEESFTIHLGAQLKTTHNLRLLCTDVLDLCKHKSNKIGGHVVAQPQRLQTAMSLYSNELCAAVLLVDNRLNSYIGIKRDFAQVCQQSTDFHFADLSHQFEHIEDNVVSVSEEAGCTADDMADGVSLRSVGSLSSDTQDKTVKLPTGSFYMTRHSNLSEVHIMFHLVVDDNIRSSDISSRHAVILGYRNILKACYRHDIHTITLPLLLVHEMSEEMTIPWCMKRAELVFKCVKGFMMELATWSGPGSSRNIQFLVPKGISDETFAAFSSMLVNIFRMSNPVVA